MSGVRAECPGPTFVSAAGVASSGYASRVISTLTNSVEPNGPA